MAKETVRLTDHLSVEIDNRRREWTLSHNGKRVRCYGESLDCVSKAAEIDAFMYDGDTSLEGIVERRREFFRILYDGGHYTGWS